MASTAERKRSVTRLVNLALALASLSRISLAPLTISVPVLGALSAGVPTSRLELLGLALVGLCAHCFGFALNDLLDLPFDRQADARQADALVTGRIGQVQAWAFTLLQVPVAFGVYALISGSAPGMAVLGLSVALSVGYNRWSKSGRLPRLLPELALALSTALLCLAGAWLAPGLPRFTSLLFAGALGLVLLLLNSVASGLKDLKSDQAGGARSFVIAAGCRMVGEDRMQLSRLLRGYSAAIQAGIWLCSLGLAALTRPGWPVSALVIGLSLFGALHLRMLLSLDSFSALRRAKPLLSGFYNYTALALLLSPGMPLWMVLGYGLFAAWLLSIPLRLSWRVWQGYNRSPSAR